MKKVQLKIDPDHQGESDEEMYVPWSYEVAGVGAYFPEKVSSKLESQWQRRGDRTPEAPITFQTPDGRSWHLTAHDFQMTCSEGGETLKISRNSTSPTHSDHDSESYTPEELFDAPPAEKQSSALFRQCSENEWTPDEVAKMMNEMREQIANLSMEQMDDKVTWAYTDSRGKTHAYPAEFCSLLEILLNTRTSKDKETPYICKNGETCMVNLTTWEHKVVSTGEVFQVRRKYKQRRSNQEARHSLRGTAIANQSLQAAPNLLSSENENLWEPDDVDVLSKEMKQEMMKLSLMLNKNSGAVANPNTASSDNVEAPHLAATPHHNPMSPMSQMSVNLYTWDDEEDSWDPEEVSNIRTEISVHMTSLAEMLVEGGYSDSEDWDPSRDRTPSYEMPRSDDEEGFGKVFNNNGASTNDEILSDEEEEVLGEKAASNNLCRGSNMDPEDVHKLAQEMKSAMDRMALEKAEEVEWYFLKNGKESFYPESFGKILEVLKGGRRRQNTTPYVDGNDTCIIDLKNMIHRNLVTGEVWPVRRRVKSTQQATSPRGRKQQLVDGMKKMSKSMASLFTRKNRAISTSR